jgi:hypothetical protein
MLAQLVIINRSTEDLSPLMQVQVSELKGIRRNAENIETASRVIQDILEGSRDNRRLLHVQVH